MNGAAMNCRQDPGLRPQHQDPSSLHNPGFHLQNLQPQNSKTLNYPSFSSNYQVDGYYDNFHQYESRHTLREMEDPRFPRPRAVKRRSEPIDLPVPKFEIDEHSVNDQQNINDALTQGSKALDLDTRIGLLIKSKALAGMHPIFSDLNDSEESDNDLDDPFLSRPKSKFRKENTKIHPAQRETEMPIRESFDDPEKPLSRPPSPFLSRATYLFWFNKAIEIKQQAKAQEQALLEQATKRLIHDTSSLLQTNQPDMSQKRHVSKNLLDEISKELKEVIKQEFIREVIEKTAFNTLDDWWEKQNHKEKRDKSDVLKIINNNSNENHKDLPNNKFVNLESQGSTSPKMPFPWEKETNELNNYREEVGLKHTCCDQVMSENKALCKNNKESFDCTKTVPRDVVTISGNSASIVHQEPGTEETSGEDLKRRCKLKCHKVSNTMVKSYGDKINMFTSEEHNDSGNILNCVQLRSNTFESEVFDKRSGIPQHLHSNSNDTQEGKMGEKYAIVKDILDFIFNNVNKIVVQRDDNIYMEENENLSCKTFSNLASSVESLPTDNTKQVPSEELTNVTIKL